jgi:DNA (cytosine-5)-methyltransferase 1
MKPWAYYNDIDPFSCAWTRELIKAGLIPDGEVDERSIWDVVPNDLRPFQQAHFCNGISTWAYALRQANFPTDRVVWSGSMPCQSFSAAGVGKGMDDNRGQLWYAFFWLIRVCRPDIVIGEQVEAAIKHDWLDHVALSLESIGYAVGAVGFPACSTGAPHVRQRLYWVADARHAEFQKRRKFENGVIGSSPQRWSSRNESSSLCASRRVADAEGSGQLRAKEHEDDGTNSSRGRRHDASHNGENAGVLGDSDGAGLQEQRGERGTSRGQVGAVQGQAVERTSAPTNGMVYAVQPESEDREQPAQSVPVERGPTNGFWRNAEWLPCRDNKARPTGRGIRPLVTSDSQRARLLRAQKHEDDAKDSRQGWGYDFTDDGENNEQQLVGPTQSSPLTLAPGTPAGMVHGGDQGPQADEIDPQNTAEARVGRLRGYGNSLCAPAAEAFIKSYMEVSQ